MWIRTKDGFVNSDHVVEISSDYAGEKSILHLVGGKTAVAQGDPYELALELNSIIQALPGYQVLHLNWPGAEPVFFQDPIIAWSVSVQPDTMVAITTNGATLTPMAGVAILYPDGRVYASYRDKTFPNSSAWVVEEREHEAKAVIPAAAAPAS